MTRIDLRSDTLTKPTPDMIKVMAAAETGDDAYGEDRQVIQLQEYCANYFDKPAALFMPSGTMSNQVAIRALTQPGDEVICDAGYHINFFESSQTADLGKVVLNPIHSTDGVITTRSIEQAVESKARWNTTYASPGLIWVENSISTYAGKVFPLPVLKDISAWCRKAEVPLFIDGARLLNASVAAKVHPAKYAALSDALTICFAKGLGAPFGSVLIGSKDFIAKAARFRKWFGGGLHQSGFMAAAALYALKHNVDRLAEDHHNAVALSSILSEEGRFNVSRAETNMVIFDIGRLGISADEFVKRAAEENVSLMAWRADEVRAVTSINVSRAQVEEAGYKLLRIAKSLVASHEVITFRKPWEGLRSLTTAI